ncbi:MAG: gliding motility-associated C-terminal domain-containing protein [Saprospiraceae bacterium]
MNSYSSNVMISTKTYLRLAILFCSSFLLFSQDLKATHIVGGDMTYRCLGNNIYEIKLTMRRDCFQGAANAQFDDPASIGIYDGISHQLLVDLLGFPGGELRINFNADDTLNEFLHSDCSVVSGDVCVHTTMYIKNIVLPYRASGYTLAYQRCCRNGTLNNIVDPLNTGMTVVAELSATAQLECNSSPQFLAYPSIYVCVNKDIDFDAHAVDFEHDSLVYSLCTPYAGGDIQHNKPQPPPQPPYDLIAWKPPYNLANLLGGGPLKIDPKTGHLSGKPNAVGQYIVGYCVTAYKRGTNIITGVTRRDFQYNVRMCRDVPVANFSAPSLDCSNDNLTITFDNQSILADDYLWIFDYDHKSTSDTSTEFEPSYTFPHEGFFNVALIVRDSGMFCHDTIIHQVGVFNTQINADFTYDVSSCDEAGIVLNVHDQSAGFNPNFPAATYQWLLTVTPSVGLGIFPSTSQNPTFNFDIDEPATACLSFVVTASNGCSATHTECFPVRELQLLFEPGSGHICNGDSTLLLNGESGLNYLWSPTSGLFFNDSSDLIAFPNITTEYLLTVTDGLCVVTGHTQVEVQQLPVLAFSSETDCKSLTANFTNSSTGNLYHWDFGVAGNLGSNATSPVFTFPESGIYTIVLSSRDGCDVSTSQQITVNAISEKLDPQTINCFQPTVELNPDNNGGYLYSWSNGSHDANPIVTVEDDTTFYVTISSPGLPGCEIVDSIRVIIPTPFAIDAGNNVTNCKFDDVTLTATLNGVSPNNVDFTWKVNGNPFSDLQSIVVNPSTTATYYVTATDSLGCSQTDSVKISKSDPGFVVNAPLDSVYCDIQIITLNASSIPGVSFAWFNEAGDTIGTEASIDVTPGSHACFRVVGTDPLGCQNDSTVCLTPTFLSLGITGGQGICLGESATICVTNNHPEQNLNYQWNTSAGESCITVSPSVTTPYAVTVTNADLGCSDTLTSTVTVNLFDPVDVIITSNVQGDTTILGGPDQVQLFVNQDPTFGYTWTSSGGDAVPSVWNPNVTPTISGDITYTVTVVNAEGCIGIATYKLTVLNPPCNDEDIFLPTAFTPNGDGVNDVLFVRSNFISTMELHIYNRWGQEVFKTTNQALGWDGTFKGERLSPDVFGYYMNITCPNGRSFFKKGNITLLE